jgi:hypothetical protein
MADSRIFPSLSEKPNAASISAPAPLRTACEEPFAFPDTNLICTFPFSPFREANPEKKSRLSFHGSCACLFVYRVFAFRQRQLITAMLSYHGKKAANPDLLSGIKNRQHKMNSCEKNTHGDCIVSRMQT